jgi:DtxR family transcriptional regulator, Mn-dependent transcriptional regulator
MPRSREQIANTESVDNYLKAIFHLSGGESNVSAAETWQSGWELHLHL